MKNKKTSVALYHRVSTADQDAGGARVALRAAAQARGLTPVLDVEETGSGAKNNRPGLQQVLNAAAHGQLSAVMVWKLDRFGRSALDLLANIQQLENSGVRFIACSQSIDIHPGGGPMSRLLLTMLAAVAEFERELIRERTQLGLEKARRRGAQLGRPRVEVDLDRALALRAAGHSLASAATVLGVGKATLHRALARVAKPVPRSGKVAS